MEIPLNSENGEPHHCLVSEEDYHKIVNNNDSRLHLLAKSNNFPNLKSIDLSENDISNLNSTLDSLKDLKSIRALDLEGNPCWVLPEYKTSVLQHFPNLKYLDGTEVIENDFNELLGTSDLNRNAHIVFECYRIMGLPEPPKDKKNLQTIHIEINFPLLLDELPNEDISENQEQQQWPKEEIMEQDSKESKKKRGPDKQQEKKEDKKDKSELKKTKKKSYYSGENELLDEQQEAKNLWFKSERMPWSKIIQFASMEMGDDSKQNNLLAIRDTFRSVIPIRIVYLKTLYSPKSKKSSKKDKKTKKGASAAVETVSELLPDEIGEGEQKENVLKKIVLASFYCELKSINWSENSIDFYWADHPAVGPKALAVEGSLKALEYDVNAAPKKNRTTIKQENQDTNERVKEFLPNVLTCQVGFGLNRTRQS